MTENQIVVPLPKIFIGREVLSRRVQLYLREKHPLLSASMSTPDHPRQDTKSVWYSRAHIQTWLDEIDLMKADGMRIYMGAYEEGEAAGQLCLLMVLTRGDSESQVHRDIIIENEPDFPERLTLSRSIELDDGEAHEKPKEYNYGSPCPPICYSGEEFG